MEKDYTMIVSEYTQLIGRTPMLEIRRAGGNLCRPGSLAKLEIFNPMSIKDRAVLYMVRALADQGKLHADTEVVEASSGNTAIAAEAANHYGIQGSCLYERIRQAREREIILKAFGRDGRLRTPAAEHTRGARDRAIAYAKQNANAHFLNQHDNEASLSGSLPYDRAGNLGRLRR